jgi:UTP--glucose-1-phosphate uridylyltransferase
VLKPRIFHHLRGLAPGAGEELQLTDAIHSLLGDEQVLAYRYLGTRFDCGSKLGYLKATIEFGLRHPEVGAAFRDYLDGFIFEAQSSLRSFMDTAATHA